MTTIFAHNYKSLWLIHRALEERISSEEARYRLIDRSEDAEGDFGNDLYCLKLLREEFGGKCGAGSGHATLFQCWADLADGSISLLPLHTVIEHCERKMLSDAAKLLYTFPAETPEEAMAIHHLRQGWAPYQPRGEPAACPQCGAKYFPRGSGDCWRCGHVG